MNPQLKLEVIYVPHSDAEREVAEALDALADALADQFIARARTEVARERGVAEEAIGREHGHVADAARSLSPIGWALRQAFEPSEGHHVTHIGTREENLAACRLSPAKSRKEGTR